jgi:hypothetical protein
MANQKTIPVGIERMTRVQLTRLWKTAIGTGAFHGDCCFSTPRDMLMLVREVMRLRNILWNAYRGDFPALNKEGFLLNGCRVTEERFLEEVVEFWEGVENDSDRSIS